MAASLPILPGGLTGVHISGPYRRLTVTDTDRWALSRRGHSHGGAGLS
jgi:hypothetical protein